MGLKEVVPHRLGRLRRRLAARGLRPESAMALRRASLRDSSGALLAPAALSLISVTFTDSKERAKAFGVYGALAGVGGAIGLIAGGLLTQYLSWRWCLFVNTPMAIIAFSLAVPNVRESKVEGHPHYDVPGALYGDGRDAQRRVRRLPCVDGRLGLDERVAVHGLRGILAPGVLRNRKSHQRTPAAAATRSPTAFERARSSPNCSWDWGSSGCSSS